MDEKPRRWFRFNLRTLLVFVAVVGALMGWFDWQRQQSRREMELADKLMQTGSGVGFSGSFESSSFPKSQFRHWWDQWSTKVLGRRIVAITLADEESPPSHVDLTLLAGLNELQILYLDHAPVRDLTPLRGLTNLKFLSVCNTPITKSQIDALRESLPNCEIEHDLFVE